MNKKNIYFLIFIIAALLAGSGIIYYSKKSEIPEIPVLGKEYSYKNVIYNFWGFVQEKQGDNVLVKGIIPEPGKEQTEEESLITIKFKITSSTKIAKLETADKETKQVFATLEAIQPQDHLAIKADEIDVEKKEAIATDILILEPLPSLPLPSEGETTPTSSAPID